MCPGRPPNNDSRMASEMDADGTVVPEVTAAAPTEAAPDVQPSTQTAYSAEPLDYDDPDEYPTELVVSRSWGVAAGIAALVVVLGAVVAVLVWLVGQPSQSAQLAYPTTPPSSVTVTQQPPVTVTVTPTATIPPPVTVTAEPPPSKTVAATPEVIETPAVDLPTYDRLFVQRLRDMGWSIWDEKILADNAHYACGRLRSGAPVELVNQEYVAGTGTPMMSAVQFTAAAMSVYPNCP